MHAQQQGTRSIFAESIRLRLKKHLVPEGHCKEKGEMQSNFSACGELHSGQSTEMSWSMHWRILLPPKGEAVGLNNFAC